MTGNPLVSVVIPTHKRAHLLDHVLDALTKQTYRHFEVLIILKPSGDRTEDVLKKYDGLLEMKLIVQTEGYITDALNLGLKSVIGDITAFIDDDALPFPEWIQSHVETYALPNVGGVAGNVMPATLNGKRPLPIKGKPSEFPPKCSPFMPAIGRKLWSYPLKGLEDYLVYISKAGIVDYNYEISDCASRQITKSLLGMGANMSVLSKAIEDFRFPSSWILGLSWEQFLGWHLWKKGYSIFFNPKAKVYHIVHGQTLTRNIKDTKRETLRWVERNLLFYRLYKTEPQLSKMYRIIWLIYLNILTIKRICKDKELYRTNQLKSIFYSEIMGLKWILSRRIGGKYNPLVDLGKFL
ncbi:MAG: glycosyltransferase [Promethearchaeota archaeon]